MQGNHAEIGLPRQLLRSFSVTVKYSAELVHGDYEDLDNPGASVPITVMASQEDPAAQDPDADQPSDPDTDTDPVEIPDSDNPIVNTPAAAKETPATRWVYAGVVGLTSMMLFAAIQVVRYGSKKK